MRQDDATDPRSADWHGLGSCCTDADAQPAPTVGEHRAQAGWAPTKRRTVRLGSGSRRRARRQRSTTVVGV